METIRHLFTVGYDVSKPVNSCALCNSHQYTSRCFFMAMLYVDSCCKSKHLGEINFSEDFVEYTV